MLKRILVGLAGTPYTDAAIREATDLAKVHGAEVTGVTVVDTEKLSHVGPAPIGAEAAGIELRDHRLRMASEHVDAFISQFEEACHAAGVPHRVLREQGDAFKKMVSDSRYHDLTVFGLKSVFEYFFEDVDSGGLLSRLVGGGVRPILAVATDCRPIRRVLVAYSGSVGSAKTLKEFAQLRLWPEAAVRVVTFGNVEDNAAELLTDAADYLRTHGFDPEIDHAPGSAHDGLVPYADKWEADLIVLGNSARNFLMRQIFGEVALHTIQHAGRPLFLSQ